MKTMINNVYNKQKPKYVNRRAAHVVKSKCKHPGRYIGVNMALIPHEEHIESDCFKLPKLKGSRHHVRKCVRTRYNIDEYADNEEEIQQMSDDIEVLHEVEQCVEKEVGNGKQLSTIEEEVSCLPSMSDVVVDKQTTVVEHVQTPVNDDMVTVEQQQHVQTLVSDDMVTVEQQQHVQTLVSDTVVSHDVQTSVNTQLPTIEEEQTPVDDTVVPHDVQPPVDDTVAAVVEQPTPTISYTEEDVATIILPSNDPLPSTSVSVRDTSVPVFIDDD